MGGKMDYKQVLNDYYINKLHEEWKEKNRLLKIKPISLRSSLELSIDNTKYFFKQCPTLKPRKREDIPVDGKVSGVYIFVVKRNFILNLIKFFSEVTGMFFNENVIALSDHCLVPPYNGSCKNGKHHLKKDCVFYIGSSKDIGGRIYDHLTSRTYKSPTSLKLGFKFREEIKDNLDLYYCEVKNSYRNLEKNIRDEYGSYFGE